jgi:hypothetical protein
MWKISSLYFRTFCLFVRIEKTKIYFMYLLIIFFPGVISTLCQQNEFVCGSTNCHYVICVIRFHIYELCRTRLVSLVGMYGKVSSLHWQPEFPLRKLSCIKLLQLYMKKQFCQFELVLCVMEYVVCGKLLMVLRWDFVRKCRAFHVLRLMDHQHVRSAEEVREVLCYIL